MTVHGIVIKSELELDLNRSGERTDRKSVQNKVKIEIEMELVTLASDSLLLVTVAA